jgi:hypothetical protein
MRALAVLVFVLISSSSFADTSERFGKGGWYKDFQPEIARANASGELFRIKGHCQSLCTLFLGQRNINAGSTQRMLSAYNPKLQKYLIDNHYMETLAFHTIPGSRIIDTFGYRECPRS